MKLKLPWATIVETVEALIEAGGSREESIDEIVAILDASLDFEAAVPGPVGTALESVDGVALRALVGLAWDTSASLSRERRAERKLRRLERRAERRAARADTGGPLTADPSLAG